MSEVNLIVIAKAPVAGRSKTRLTPPCSPHQAAGLAEAALRDTLSAVAAAEAARRVLVLEGSPGTWIPDSFEVLPQAQGGLEERLAAAFEAVGGPSLLVGMDTPQLTSELLEAGARALMSPAVDAVLGPADDGGYWAIGLRRPERRVFEDVPMSTGLTFGAQSRRLEDLGLRSTTLAALRDVDTIEDAIAVAGERPGTRFAAALGRVLPQIGSIAIAPA